MAQDLRLLIRVAMSLAECFTTFRRNIVLYLQRIGSLLLIQPMTQGVILEHTNSGQHVYVRVI